MNTCTDCRERPSVSGGRWCIPCGRRRYSDMLLTALTFHEDAPVPFGGGFRMAVLCDGELEYWLCDDVHETEDDARACMRGCPHRGPHWNPKIAQRCLQLRRQMRDGR